MLQDDLRAAAAWLRLPESSEFLTIGTGFKTCDVKRLLDATVVQRDEGKGSPRAQTLATHFPGPAPLPEKREEPRVHQVLHVYIWGSNADGCMFSQQARVINISGRGALLVDVDHKLRSCDLIGLRFKENEARFRVVWTCDREVTGKYRVAVQRVEADACPWTDILAQSLGSSAHS